MAEDRTTATNDFPQPRRKPDGQPCGECHIQAGETCDICGAVTSQAPQMITCPECDGEGHHMMMSEFPVPCRTCKGARKVRWQVHFEHWLENQWSLKKKGNIKQLEAYLKAHPEMAT